MMNYRGMPGYTGANLPNDQYWSTDYKPGMGNPGGTGGGGPQYNMQSASQFAPPNEGGPGNPNGANNMAKPVLPRFTGGSFQNNKGMAPLTPFDRQVQGQGSQISQLDQRAIAADPQGFAQWQRDAAAAGYNYGNAGTHNSFQNNKGPAPMQNWGGGPNGQWNGDFSQFANQQQGGYNGSGINPGNMAQQLQGMNVPAGFRPSARGFGQSGFGAGQEAQDQDMMQRQQGYRRPMYNDPYQQYGYAGQSQSLGRYQPPMMGNPYDPQGGWTNGGGYSYNIPNSYGSGQWNQFNSTDRASSQFGQSPNTPQMGVNQSVRYPQQSQNYYSSLLQQQPQQPRYTQPGSPEQPGPVT